MPEKGKVGGNSGGVAILTCKSLVVTRFLGRNTNVSISQQVPSAVSLRITETEQLSQACGDMLSSTDSQNLKMGKIQGLLSVNPLKHVITLCGQILVSRTDDDSIPSPCVHSKRPRVYMLKHMCGWCRCTGTFLNVHTERRFLNPHTGFSTFFQRAATHTHTKHTSHDHNDTHNIT